MQEVIIFTKGEGLRTLNRKEWAKMFDELINGDQIEIVEVHY